MYYVTGTLTYATATGRTSARAALDTIIAGYTLWSGGLYSGGLTNVGTTGLTISFSVPTEAAANSFHQSLVSSAFGQIRNAGHIAVSAVGIEIRAEG